MARVFVSHASEDGECAVELHRWLVGEGHEVFLDRDLRDGIPVGEEWERRLHERLRWADAMVCVLTRAYLGSLWCSAEVGIALSRGSRVLPVRAERGGAPAAGVASACRPDRRFRRGACGAGGGAAPGGCGRGLGVAR
ncbi:MAG: toll/interleukin-1 receptor domain-containing protein [Pseudonocardiaceae bacterium]